jgi:hypothetical protein
MKVFFNYAQTDRALIEPTVAAFRDADLQAEPVESRDEASCVVVFWSRAAANSEWVQDEIRKAVKDWSSGRLLLATLDDTPLPIALRDLEPIDVRGGAKQLLARAERLVGGERRRKPHSLRRERFEANHPLYASTRVALRYSTNPKRVHQPQRWVQACEVRPLDDGAS